MKTINTDTKAFNSIKHLLFLLLLSLFLFKLDCLGQERPAAKYCLPKTFLKPTLWIKADFERNKKIIKDSSNNEIIVSAITHGGIPRELKFADYFDIIKRQSDFQTFLAAKKWSITNYESLFPYLINLLIDTTNVGITNLPDTILIEGDRNNLIIRQNLSTISGRASFILNELTGENFCTLKSNSSMAESERCQMLWVTWIKKLKKG